MVWEVVTSSLVSRRSCGFFGFSCSCYSVVMLVVNDRVGHGGIFERSRIFISPSEEELEPFKFDLPVNGRSINLIKYVARGKRHKILLRRSIDVSF